MNSVNALRLCQREEFQIGLFVQVGSTSEPDRSSFDLLAE
jgi:hypothetical protein